MRGAPLHRIRASRLVRVAQIAALLLLAGAVFAITRVHLEPAGEPEIAAPAPPSDLPEITDRSPGTGPSVDLDGTIARLAVTAPFGEGGSETEPVETPAPVETAGGWSYLGCFLDPGRSAALVNYGGKQHLLFQGRPFVPEAADPDRRYTLLTVSSDSITIDGPDGVREVARAPSDGLVVTESRPTPITKTVSTPPTPRAVDINDPDYRRELERRREEARARREALEETGGVPVPGSAGENR